MKDGGHTAHVGRQYIGNVGKVGNGVVSVSSLWADEHVYYPLNVIPYTPAGWFEYGKKDPGFRTKLAIAVDLVKQAVAQRWPFKAVVADALYGDDGTVRESLHGLGVGFVMVLKPSHSWWHPQGEPGSVKEAAQTTARSTWRKVERTFRDGHRETWWALELRAGPYGPQQSERAVVVTTDPDTLPELSTWYLVTNLPLPDDPATTQGRHPLPSASLAEVVRLYGLRNWVEQSYKQVKSTLGWSQYQVRGSRAIMRHWILVYCAFTFCWWQAARREELGNSGEHAMLGDVQLQQLGESLQQRQSDQQSREKKSRRSEASHRAHMAEGATVGPELAGTGHHAQTLLARVLDRAPATGHTAAIRSALAR